MVWVEGRHWKQNRSYIDWPTSPFFSEYESPFFLRLNCSWIERHALSISGKLHSEATLFSRRGVQKKASQPKESQERNHGIWQCVSVCPVCPCWWSFIQMFYFYIILHDSRPLCQKMCMIHLCIVAFQNGRNVVLERHSWRRHSQINTLVKKKSDAQIAQLWSDQIQTLSLRHNFSGEIHLNPLVLSGYWASFWFRSVIKLVTGILSFGKCTEKLWAAAQRSSSLSSPTSSDIVLRNAKWALGPLDSKTLRMSVLGMVETHKQHDRKVPRAVREWSFWSGTKPWTYSQICRRYTAFFKQGSKETAMRWSHKISTCKYMQLHATFPAFRVAWSHCCQSRAFFGCTVSLKPQNWHCDVDTAGSTASTCHFEVSRVAGRSLEFELHHVGLNRTNRTRSLKITQRAFLWDAVAFWYLFLPICPLGIWTKASQDKLTSSSTQALALAWI